MSKDIIKHRRQSLQKALVLNAATKPVNMLIPSATVAAGVFIGAPIFLMLMLGIFTWIAASAATFFDAEEAEEVGKQFRSNNQPKSLKAKSLHPLAQKDIEQVDKAFKQLQNTISSNQQSLPEIEIEAEALKTMAYQSAAKASGLLYLLDEQNTHQIQYQINNLKGTKNVSEQELLGSLQKQLDNLNKASQQVHDFKIQIAHLVSELQVVRSTIATSSSISDKLLSEKLAEESKMLREKTEAMQDLF